MRKLASALAVVALSALLGGCWLSTGQSVLTGGSSIITPIPNPISLNQQYEIEAAVAAARRPAVSYMRLRQCRKSETASVSNLCGYRSVKVKIQAADRKLQAALISVRNFVRNNPTISGFGAVSAFKQAIADYKNELALNGVN